MIGTTPIPSVLRPTLRQSAQSGRVGSFQQHHCTLMVGRKPGDHSVGLFGIMRPLHHRRVGGNRLAACAMASASASNASSEVLRPSQARPHRPRRRICRRPHAGDAHPVRAPACSENRYSERLLLAPACQRDRPSSPAFMESGLALNESSISVNDVSGLVTVDTAMRCGLMLVTSDRPEPRRQSACPTSSPPWLRQARS